MAYDKIIPIQRRLDHCVDYALNEEKTSLQNVLSYTGNPVKTHQLVTGINCDPARAYRDMQDTKRRWDKKGGILGYHIIHSYAPGETTPEQAHAAGVEFARRLLGERYEAVVCTHIDRGHLHCHIVFNSVSFLDGKKYRSDFDSYFNTLRDTSNEVSREFGLSVIEPEGHGKQYAQWDAERRGKGAAVFVRQDIDAAIRESFTFDMFLAALRRQGYTVKYGSRVKHTAVTPPGGGRAFRLDSLGDGYTEADIRARLAMVRNGTPPPLPPPPPLIPRRYTIRRGKPRQTPRQKLHGFRALYVYYLYLLGGKRPRRRRPVPSAVRADVAKLRQYQRQYQLLREYRIDNDGELAMLGEALQARIDALVDQRRDLYGRKRVGEDVEAAIAAIDIELRQLRRNLKTCGRIAEDIPRIRGNLQLDRAQEQQHQPHPEQDRTRGPAR